MVVATDSNRSVESVCFGAAQTKRASDFSLEAPQFERTVCKPTSTSLVTIPGALTLIS